MSGVVPESQPQQALFTAAEAKAMREKVVAATKEETEQKIQRDVPAELNDVLEDIKIAAKRGDPNVKTAWISSIHAKVVMERVAIELRRLGYVVLKTGSRDCDQYQISWA